METKDVITDDEVDVTRTSKTKINKTKEVKVATPSSNPSPSPTNTSQSQSPILPPPKPGSTKKIGMILAAIIIISVILINVISFGKNGGFRPRREPNATIELAHYRQVMLDTHPLGYFQAMLSPNLEETPVINLGMNTGKRIEWYFPAENVPFDVEINGGRAHGGLEYTTPSETEAKRTGWKSPHYPRQIAKIRFKRTHGVCTTSQVTVPYKVF